MKIIPVGKPWCPPANFSKSHMRIINVPAGIGDNIWLLQKLVNAGEQFIFQMSSAPPQRGKQIFDLLPQVSAECRYVKGLGYNVIAKANIQKYRPYWKRIRESFIYLSANKHLENGYRIEEFLPDLPTSYRVDWVTTKEDIASAERLTGYYPEAKHIGIYASAYSTQRAWGFWDEHMWFQLIKQIHEKDPGYVFLIIGAEWDTDLGVNLVKLLADVGIHWINSIGESLGTVVEIMKRLHYMFAFPSGLGILAPTVNCPVTMFYPPHLEKMINAWASPEDIESGLYHGTLFCSPEEAFDWAVQNGKI